IGRVRSDGIELGATNHVSANVYTQLSYTYLHRNEDESTGLRLTRRPQHSGSFAIGRRSGAMDTNIVILHTGEREDSLAIFPFTRTTNRAYTTIDANIQYRLSRVTPF